MIAIEFMIQIERTLIKIFLPVRDCKIPQLGPGPPLRRRGAHILTILTRR